jgi:hypothetical protein
VIGAVACVLLAVAGCGRVGFRAARDGGDVAPADSSDDATTAEAPDASPCVDGDGTCPQGCAGLDSDCVAVCGDGMCVGNAGETCGNCMADCDTMADVCGNGFCDPGEDGTNCATDCGPSPWPAAYVQLEADGLAAMNQLRTGGVTCPGDAMPTVAGAVIGDPPDGAMAARRMAWQIAHEPYYPSSGALCNGVGLASVLSGYGEIEFLAGCASGSCAMNVFAGSDNTCADFMKASWTHVTIGAVFDPVNTSSFGWVVFFK